MGNYIRRVRVSELFDQNSELVVDFDQSINCIYGVNGTGKTVFINLIVNALKVNISELLATPFLSITILTSSDGKKQPENFLTVEKRGDDISYFFHNDYECVTPLRLGGVNPYKVKKGIRYVPDRNQRRLGSRVVTTEFGEDVLLVPIRALKVVLMSHLSLTYVPLLRHSDSYDYRIAASELRRQRMPEEAIGEIVDPNIRVLKELQEEFSRRYASAQSDIARRLESLSSIIFEKLLFGEGNEEGTNKATSFIAKLLRTGRIDGDDSKIESVISQINDLHLKIPEEKIRENYQSWIKMQKNVLEARDALSNISQDISEDEKENVSSKYSEAYFNLFASARLYKKLENAIEEIQKVHLSKQLVLSPFNLFKKEINQFLSGTKEFTFDDSGEFQFSNNGQNLDIANLSSGEKHLVAILGRVSFSSSTGTATFIADEPELSLHLEWQREILPAIHRLSPNTQIIVATHAPAIISKNANKIDIEACYKNA